MAREQKDEQYRKEAREQQRKLAKFEKGIRRGQRRRRESEGCLAVPGGSCLKQPASTPRRTKRRSARLLRRHVQEMPISLVPIPPIQIY